MEDILHIAHHWLQNQTFLILFALFLGLLAGSFLNVVIYRLPKMIERQDTPAKPFNLWFPHSHCPACQTLIRPWENIPVLSYLCLRGQCKRCQATIPVRYPFVELLTGLLSAFLAFHYGYSPALFASLGLTWLLIALTFIDLDTYLLPDDLTYLGLWAGLILSLCHVFVSPADAILGATLGYLSLWSLYWVFKWLTHKEGLGYGDFKLMALAGAWVGWQLLPLVILIGSLTGAFYGVFHIVFKNMHKDHPLPFGPFLALGLWLTLLYGNKIFDTYLNWVL